MKITNFKCRLINSRVKTSDRCPSHFYYEFRHGDDFGTPLTLEAFVAFNLWGTLVSNIDLSLLFIRRDYFKLNKAVRGFIYDNVDCDEFDGKYLFQKIII